MNILQRIRGYQLGSAGSGTADEFIFTVKTDNTGPSANDQFQIIWGNVGHANDCEVFWGDDTSETVTTTTNITHTYPVAGTYQIRIKGQNRGLRFNNSGDKEKLISIEQWGNVTHFSDNAFFGCRNLISITATDVLYVQQGCRRMFYICDKLTSFPAEFSVVQVFDPGTSTYGDMFRNCTVLTSLGGFSLPSQAKDISWLLQASLAFNESVNHWNVSNVTNMSSAFRFMNNFNQSLSNWDVSNVTNFFSMFRDCSAFDQDLSSWDISSATNMGDMFLNTTLSTTNYSNTLIGWNNLPSPPTGITFSGGNSKYNAAGETARNNLVSTHGWTITDGGLEV